MAASETQFESLIQVIKEATQTTDVKTARSRLRLRSKKIQDFVTTAGDLLENYPQDPLLEPPKLIDRVTRPIEVNVDGSIVQVQVGTSRSTYTTSFEDRFYLLATPEGEEQYFKLFSVEREHSDQYPTLNRTKIRNHLDGIPTDPDLDRSLGMIDYLGQQLKTLDSSNQLI